MVKKDATPSTPLLHEQNYNILLLNQIIRVMIHEYHNNITVDTIMLYRAAT